MQGEGLAAGVGTEGKTIGDGSADDVGHGVIVVSLQIQIGGLGVPDEIAGFLEIAGDAEGDGLCDAIEFLRCWGFDRIEDAFLVEGAVKVGPQHTSSTMCCRPRRSDSGYSHSPGRCGFFSPVSQRH